MWNFVMVSLWWLGAAPGALENLPDLPGQRICNLVSPDGRIDFEALTDTDAALVGLALQELDHTGRDARAVARLARGCTVPVSVVRVRP